MHLLGDTGVPSAPVKLENSNSTYMPTVGTYSGADYRVVVVNGLKFTVDASKFIPTILKTGETFSVFETDCGDHDMNLSIIINIADTSYEKEMKSPENLTSKYTSIGGTIIKDIKEVTINNRKCAYFTVNISNMPYLIAYTSGDKDKKVCMESQIDETRVSDALNMFTKVANSLVSTDEPDTTFEDQQLPGAIKKSSSLALNGKTVEFKVPEGLYSTSNLSSETSALEYFSQKDIGLNVTASLEHLSYDTGSVENYLNMLKDASSSHDNFSSSEIKTLKSNGRDVKYFSYEFTVNDLKVNYFYAICDLGNNFRFTICASEMNSNPDKVAIDLVKDFFDITEK